MAVKIRFSRIGKKHAPVYKIIAIDSRRKRDGKYLENLGTYNPMTKEIVQFHAERINYWISVGAIVADSVERLIKIKQKQAGFVRSEPKKTIEPKVKASVEKKPRGIKKTVEGIQEVADVEKKAATKISAVKKTSKVKTVTKK
ncbi:30S ribosomal protein S16 [Candidatus Dependentiae bacterium]|nr:30S ribosomal protein S16 [Candidatus Dependentiae bacterium]